MAAISGAWVDPAMASNSSVTNPTMQKMITEISLETVAYIVPFRQIQSHLLSLVRWNLTSRAQRTPVESAWPKTTTARPDGGTCPLATAGRCQA